jgi:hypothetical protein
VGLYELKRDSESKPDYEKKTNLEKCQVLTEPLAQLAKNHGSAEIKEEALECVKIMQDIQEILSLLN